MKTFLLAILSTLLLSSIVRAQNIEGQIIASQYGQWKVQGYASNTYTFSPNACRVLGGASSFLAFAVGTPVLIVDGNPALDEVVTPSAVVINNVTCSITINPVHSHNLPFYLTSATGGLQEAINANSMNPGTNTIILNNAWYQLGGSASILSSVRGTAALGLVDVTTLPSTWYRWNGTAYVVVPVLATVNSVFGRTGAVTAQAGDYTCAQVTGCLTSAPVTSVFGRTGTVTAQSGDYPCSFITNCVPNAVPTVFGRAGAITAQAGDYTCLMVTGCGTAPANGWAGSLAANQASTDTTASISLSGGLIPSGGGCFWIDSEWECFASSTSLGGGNYTLNGVTRGLWTTSAAPHTSGTGLHSMIQSLFPQTQSNYAWTGGTATGGYFFAINCPFGSSDNDTVLFEIGCPSGNSFAIQSNESFIDFSSALSHIVGGGLTLNGTAYSEFSDLLNNTYALTRSAQILQTGLPNQVTASVGFGAGFPDNVEAVQPPNAGAPLLLNYFIPSGSTTNTYVCQGTDAFGNNIPGTSASINNLAASGWSASAVIVFCPPIPGAMSTSIYRTAGVPNTGLIATSATAQYTFSDNYTSASSGSPNPTNTTVPVVCTSGTQFCILSGTTSTPPVSCTASQEGWEYHDVAANPSFHLYRCESGTWTGIN